MRKAATAGNSVMALVSVRSLILFLQAWRALQITVRGRRGDTALRSGTSVELGSDQYMQE